MAFLENLNFKEKQCRRNTSQCCQIRTGILFLGFLLGFGEVSLWVFYYTWRPEIRAMVRLKDDEADYDVPFFSVVVLVDLIVNIAMISGANKDYSGRSKDLP